MTVLPFETDAEVELALPVVATHLSHGRLLAYPTETIYGLGSRTLPGDVEELVRLKGRSEGKPFLLLVSSREMAEREGLSFSRSASTLADRFWPGPLTLVLPGEARRLPDILLGPGGGVAVRWTSHAGMLRLIAHLGFPITSTSANRTGQPPAPGAEAIVAEFGSAVEHGTLMVLNGGVLGDLPPSTVVDCTRSAPRMIREGAIPLRDLRDAVGSVAP